MRPLVFFLIFTLVAAAVAIASVVENTSHPLINPEIPTSFLAISFVNISSSSSANSLVLGSATVFKITDAHGTVATITIAASLVNETILAVTRDVNIDVAVSFQGSKSLHSSAPIRETAAPSGLPLSILFIFSTITLSFIVIFSIGPQDPLEHVASHPSAPNRLLQPLIEPIASPLVSVKSSPKTSIPLQVTPVRARSTSFPAVPSTHVITSTPPKYPSFRSEQPPVSLVNQDSMFLDESTLVVAPPDALSPACVNRAGLKEPVKGSAESRILPRSLAASSKPLKSLVQEMGASGKGKGKERAQDSNVLPRGLDNKSVDAGSAIAQKKISATSSATITLRVGPAPSDSTSRSGSSPSSTPTVVAKTDSGVTAQSQLLLAKIQLTREKYSQRAAALREASEAANSDKSIDTSRDVKGAKSVIAIDAGAATKVAATLAVSTLASADVQKRSIEQVQGMIDIVGNLQDIVKEGREVTRKIVASEVKVQEIVGKLGSMSSPKAASTADSDRAKKFNEELEKQKQNVMSPEERVKAFTEQLGALNTSSSSSSCATAAPSVASDAETIVRYKAPLSPIISPQVIISRLPNPTPTPTPVSGPNRSSTSAPAAVFNTSSSTSPAERDRQWNKIQTQIRELFDKSLVGSVSPEGKNRKKERVAREAMEGLRGEFERMKAGVGRVEEPFSKSESASGSSSGMGLGLMLGLESSPVSLARAVPAPAAGAPPPKRSPPVETGLLTPSPTPRIRCVPLPNVHVNIGFEFPARSPKIDSSLSCPRSDISTVSLPEVARSAHGPEGHRELADSMQAVSVEEEEDPDWWKGCVLEEEWEEKACELGGGELAVVESDSEHKPENGRDEAGEGSWWGEDMSVWSEVCRGDDLFESETDGEFTRNVGPQSTPVKGDRKAATARSGSDMPEWSMLMESVPNPVRPRRSDSALIEEEAMVLQPETRDAISPTPSPRPVGSPKSSPRSATTSPQSVQRSSTSFSLCSSAIFSLGPDTADLSSSSIHNAGFTSTNGDVDFVRRHSPNVSEEFASLPALPSLPSLSSLSDACSGKELDPSVDPLDAFVSPRDPTANTSVASAALPIIVVAPATPEIDPTPVFPMSSAPAVKRRADEDSEDSEDQGDARRHNALAGTGGNAFSLRKSISASSSASSFGMPLSNSKSMILDYSLPLTGDFLGEADKIEF
ncbi:hypothetical protein BOTBODRAFT_27470 [Botryobasidium botryosum FD-172 SS1]|uniref:Uncharacterized protein n=1 Tax=Botryobasidium botryosum (strain FD-172 SS1) TaxID=930990 RepID=A0A067N8E1_BOTB1|nr:hypothetical protein BOTBODRAFT_27470 [Botryobasidium botryosum FD-172 SS1]